MATKLTPQEDGLGFDSIELDFDANDDLEPMLSLHSMHAAALVCSFVTRLRCRALKRRQLENLSLAPPLPPPAYSPSSPAELVASASTLATPVEAALAGTARPPAPPVETVCAAVVAS